MMDHGDQKRVLYTTICISLEILFKGNGQLFYDPAEFEL